MSNTQAVYYDTSSSTDDVRRFIPKHYIEVNATSAVTLDDLREEIILEEFLFSDAFTKEVEATEAILESDPTKLIRL